MNICVLGWYGSETLGDRAILDGVIRVFSILSDDLIFNIGSLYPVLTNRTIFEDQKMYKRHVQHIELECFDVKNKKQLKQAINNADYVIMGGGPLMDLKEMFIIKYGFRYAQKRKIKTSLVGCGYGPLKQKAYQKCLIDIVGYSDAIIMRSENCKNQLEKLIAKRYPNKKIYSSLDPAIISVLDYKTTSLNKSGSGNLVRKSEWIINVRDMDYVYGKKDFYYPRIRTVVSKIAKSVSRLTLMPMHTFIIGGDDRYIQNRIVHDLNYDNLKAIQKPLSLKEAYDLVSNAEGCIGMRYHSIVFQSFLHGNNYILDYTDFKNGKIKAFLDLVDTNNFYHNRYINMLNDGKFDFCPNDNRFVYEDNNYLKSCNKYVEILSAVRGKS